VANQVFSCSTPCDLLVVDEVGPSNCWAAVAGRRPSASCAPATSAWLWCLPARAAGEFEPAWEPAQQGLPRRPSDQGHAPAAITMEVLPAPQAPKGGTNPGRDYVPGGGSVGGGSVGGDWWSVGWWAAAPRSSSSTGVSWYWWCLCPR